MMDRESGSRRERRRVGVRELRQNLSVYIDRVKTGETLQVTEHGHVVAVLAPLPAGRLTALERMVAEGLASPPTASLKELPAASAGPAGRGSSEDVVSALRDERL